MADGIYDYIVIGSGSGGGVVAARLSENGKYRVLCLEAGTKGAHYIWTHSPLASAFMIEDPKVNWCDQAEPNPDLGNRSLPLPHGKLLGGTSAMNSTICNRGQRGDYDAWAQAGCKGWSFEDVLPFFKKIERTTIGTDHQRGRNGPIVVTESAKITPFYDLFIQSAVATGLPHNSDYYGGTQTGVAMAQLAVSRGRRQSTATKYLAPARRRPNLEILRGAEATSLILEGKKCVGVRYRRNDAMHTVMAVRETVVCGGAINTPKLLEHSGIGNPEVLSKYGIAVAHALPGVGENMRDHYGPALKWTFARPGYSISDQGRGWKLGREVLRYALLGQGFISQSLGTMRVFARSHEGVEEADIALIANPFMIDQRGGRREMSPIDGCMVWAQVQRPESAGSVHIKSADPFAAPAVNYRFLETENDRRAAITAVRKAREIVSAPPLADVIKDEILPGPQVESDDEILDFIRRTGTTTFHFCGTCKMGVDKMAVVDERLRVHGIEGLRIADASIMPMIISGNTSIPCMMIGEKAAAMIQEDGSV